MIDPDLEAPLGLGDVSCDDGSIAGVLAEQPAADAVSVKFSPGHSYLEGDYAECVIPGPSSSQGSWVSFTAQASWNTSGQKLDLYDAESAYTDGSRTFDYWSPPSGDLGAQIQWDEASANGAPPVGDITVSITADTDFALGAGAFHRYFDLHGIVRIYRTPVLGSHPSIAATEVGAGFQVTHASGNVTTSVADVAQPGHAGVRLELGRSYNSLSTASGLMGPGWIVSYERRIELDTVNGNAVYVAADGREWVFPAAGTGAWTRAEGQEASLQTSTASGASYELVYLDGRRELFAADGRLIRETWPMGHAIEYSAPTPVTGGLQFTIGDGQGHALTGFIDASIGRITSVKDELDRTWQYGYTGGRLTSVTAPDNGAWQYTYNAQGLLASATDPVNRQTSFAYDTAGSATTVTDPGTSPYVFDYDPMFSSTLVTFGTHETETYFDPTTGAAEEIINAEGDSMYFEYNERGQTLIETDENGDELEYTYDANGCKTSELDADYNETTYANFTAFCQPRQVTDAEANTTTYTFDAAGNQLTMTTPAPDSKTTTWTYSTTPQPDTMDPPAGATIQYDYDPTGQVTDEYWIDAQSQTHHVVRNTYDAAGQRLTTRQGDLAPTTIAYDPVGRLKRTTDPLTHYTETTYDKAGQVIAERDKNGGVTEYGYDERGYQTTVTDPLDNTRETVFNQHGDAISVTDARQHTTHYTYDKTGNELTETDPLNRTTTYTYDKVGNQLTEKDPAGFTIATSYDSHGNETGTTHPGPYTTSTTYTGLLNPHVETDERTYSTTYGYDSVGRETSITNAEGETTQTGYDAAGRITWTENGATERTTYTLDPHGRITTTENADLTTRASTWDDAGRELTRTDELNKTTELTYDPLGRVTAELRPDGGVWEYTYDPNGNRLTETNPADETTTHTYDANNRLLSTTDPEGGVTEYEYDEGGNLVKMTDPRDKVTTYAYDDANQRVLMTDPNLVDTTYTYNSRGLLDTETTGSKTTTYAYDARGNLTTVTQGSSITTYTHDGTGNVLTHEMPDGSTINYTYDKVGRKLSETHSIRGTTTWTYDDAGRALTETTSAGTTTYDYDSMGRAIEITYPGSMIVTFTYDDAGRLESVTDWTGTRTYGRDDVGRVDTFTTVQGKSGTHTYDTSGRRIGMTYYTRTNQLISKSWVYDDAGRIITYNSGFGTLTYTYTPDGRMATRTYPNSNVETFTYDDAGRVASKQISGKPLYEYTYDTQDRLILVEQTSGGTTTSTHRYAYDSSGRLEKWWNHNDWFLTEYEYDSAGNLTGMLRSATVGPAGMNHPNTDAAIASCLTNGCSGNYATALDRYVQAHPHPHSPTSSSFAEGVAVLRYLHNNQVRLREYAHDASGILSSYRRTWRPSWTTVTHDPRGNLEHDIAGNSVITFDHASRPASRTRFGHQATWTHDGLLKSIVHTAGSNYPALNYDYDDEGNILWTQSAGGGTSADYHYVRDHTGIIGHNGTFWYDYNLRGDVQRAHQHNGGWTADVMLTPWGELANSDSTGSILNLFSGVTPLYGGRDGTLPMPVGSTGLTGTKAFSEYHMGRRAYNSVLARFRQVDPLPAQEGLTDTAYSYASNDPVNRVDPSGMISVPGTAVARYCASPKRSAFCVFQWPNKRKADDQLNTVYPDRRHVTMAEGGEAYHHLVWIALMLRTDHDVRKYDRFLKPDFRTARKFIRGLANAHESDGVRTDKADCRNIYRGAEQARCIANALKDSRKDKKNNSVALNKSSYAASVDVSDDAIYNLARRRISGRAAWVRSWRGGRPYSSVASIVRAGPCYLPNRKDNPCKVSDL